MQVATFSKSPKKKKKLNQTSKFIIVSATNATRTIAPPNHSYCTLVHFLFFVETVESDKHVINHFKVGACTQGATKAIGTCTHLWKHSYIIEREAVDENLIKEDKNFQLLILTVKECQHLSHIVLVYCKRCLSMTSCGSEFG